MFSESFSIIGFPCNRKMITNANMITIVRNVLNSFFIVFFSKIHNDRLYVFDIRDVIG